MDLYVATGLGELLEEVMEQQEKMKSHGHCRLHVVHVSASRMMGQLVFQVMEVGYFHSGEIVHQTLVVVLAATTVHW
jgi:hypothetical protein